MQDERKKVVMEKLKESLLLRIAALNHVSSSTIINSPRVSSLIDNRLQHVFKSFHTPTHPPYHLMIKRAMNELNEKTGLTEEAIFKYIKKKYDNDLPFAHAIILHVHLKRLCLSGEIMCIGNGKYVAVDSEVVGECLKVKKKNKKTKNDQ